MSRNALPCIFVVLGLLHGLLFGPEALAAGMTAREVTALLFRAKPGAPVDLSRKDLTGLDLSGLDFKGAVLTGSDLFGANLTSADLSRADLRASRLDRTIILSCRFDGADLSGATLLRPSAFSTLSALAGEAPSFTRANMAGVRFFGRFNGASLRGANLARASLSPFSRSFIEQVWRTELMGADLSETDLSGADLQFVLFAFADLRRANLAGADLRQADLSRANLTGADLTRANLAGTDLDGAILSGVRGLDTAMGLDEARNAERAVR